MSKMSLTSYKVTLSKGIEQGIGATVSGAGASARVTGKASVQAKHLDSSQKYQSLQKQYNFSAGISGFWEFLTGKVGGGVSREEKQEVFSQVQNSQDFEAKFHYDLIVTGYAPNVQVDARAYYLYFAITDDQGNTFHVISTGDASADTGAVNKDDPDDHGLQPGVSENNTTITI